MRFFLGVVLAALMALQAAVPAPAAGNAGKVKDKLDKLQEEDLWGEAVLEGGRIRSIKVDSLSADSVSVREVLGPLQERPAVYALSEIRSLRELGSHRIPLRRAPYQGRKSMIIALTLEILPAAGGLGYYYRDESGKDLVLLGSVIAPSGLGYFYAGESRQGLALLGFAAAISATGIATKKDGVAAWVPLGAWVKIGSLLHLYDQIKAVNAVHREGIAVGLGPGLESSHPTLRFSWSF